jgi:hypothetical protein
LPANICTRFRRVLAFDRLPDDPLGGHVLISGLQQVFDCPCHPAMFALCNHGRQNNGTSEGQQRKEYLGDYSACEMANLLKEMAFFGKQSPGGGEY